MISRLDHQREEKQRLREKYEADPTEKECPWGKSPDCTGSAAGAMMFGGKMTVSPCVPCWSQWQRESTMKEQREQQERIKPRAVVGPMTPERFEAGWLKLCGRWSKKPEAAEVVALGEVMYDAVDGVLSWEVFDAICRAICFEDNRHFPAAAEVVSRGLTMLAREQES